MVIKTKDKIVQKVLAKMDQRSLVGQKKYGATMMEEIEGQEKDLDRFLVDVQEELMDALLYIEAARRCLTDEVEEAMLNRINIVAQNGNDGLHYDNLGDLDVEYEKII
jgi:patatin-like phospholipase/acyl hydrolase